MSEPHYSLVVPLFNEAGNLLPLLANATTVLTQLSRSYEIVLVDDGSVDATPAEIATATSRWPQVRSLTHPRNLGQSVALLDGLHSAQGEVIMTLDGDGQNDPRDLPQLARAVELGELDLACGWRVNREDGILRRLLSRIGNTVRRAVLHDPVHDAGCQLRVMRREIVRVLFPVDLMQAFVPAIAAAAGFRVGEFPVRHHRRQHGQAHFGLRQLWWRPAVAMTRVRRQIRTMERTSR